MPKRQIKNKIKSIKNTIKKKTQRLHNKLKSITNKINKVKINNKKNTMPAANTKSMNKDFKILYQDGTTVKVTGRDLVYQIPDSVGGRNDSSVMTVIPANPCYWTGTRISALAQGYQNYRPVEMKFNYVPQCAVTQQGNVIAGTLWNQAPANDNLQQSLRTSNGGQLSQCYKPFTSTVRLKSNLQYNLFKTAGQFDQESNPFIFIALAVGCNQIIQDREVPIIPGYFYVTWSFIFKNPIGNTNLFYNSGRTRYSQVLEDAAYENKTIVFLGQGDDELQCGTIMQLEDDEEDNVTAYYNGSAYTMEPEDEVWYFANSSIQQTNTLTREFGEILEYEWDVLAGQGTIETPFFFFIDEDNAEVNIIVLDRVYNYPVDIFPRTLRLYAWDDFPAEYLPKPLIFLGELYARSLAPQSTTVYQTLYKIPLKMVTIRQYTRDVKIRNNKISRKVKDKKLIPKRNPRFMLPTQQPINTIQEKSDVNLEEKPKLVKIERLPENKYRSKSSSNKYCNTIIEESQ